MLERLAELAPGTNSAAGDIRFVRAPGRINLIGEHTDYNLGYVMPAAIGLETWICSSPRADGRVRMVSLQEEGEFEFESAAPGSRREAWVDYVAGMAWSLAQLGVQMRGVDAVIDSTIPVGAGLSSSAALEIAAAWTLARDVPPLEPVALARAAQRAENEYVGVRVGLMDQYAVSLGRADHALLLDCRAIEHRNVPIPDEVTLVAIDTRTKHRLGASAYNSRRAQCERGVAVIARRHRQVASLRDVSSEMLQESASVLDDVTIRRCRHVIEENARVLETAEALAEGDMERVGRLFAQSHASLRDLYEVSSLELDALVDIAADVPGVIGARMTGAGFGGCTVNLVHDGAVEDLRQAVEREYPRRTGENAEFLVVQPADAAGLMTPQMTRSG